MLAITVFKGDITNDPAPGFGIRFERAIKTEEGHLNRSVKRYLHHVARSIDANIYLITTENPRKAAAFCVKWGVPYRQIVEAASDLEIPDICNEMELVQYYDLDQRVVQNVNSRSRGCKAELWTQVEV